MKKLQTTKKPLQTLKQEEFTPVAKKRIMRIALVNPFQVTTNGYDMESVRRKGQLAEVPLGLAYISAYIKKYDYEVKIFDAHIMAVKGFTTGNCSSLEEVEDELISRIEEFNPDVIGISCLFHYMYRTAHQIVGKIKTKMKNVTIVMGGAYPTVSPEIALSDKNIDFVVLGEGERAFLNLLEALNGRFNFDELTAVAYRDKMGQIVIKSGFVLLDSLDDIPLPDRTDFVLEDYYRYGRHFIQKFEEYEGRELKIATLTATRGCIFNCSFCLGKKIWGGGLRVRSPENVLNEIEFLKKKYGIKYFAFNDDNLLINKKFARELLQGIIDKKLDIKWTTGGMSVCGLDEEMIELMVKSGCLIFNLAIESASKETLERIHKPVTTDEAVRVVNMIRKHRDTYVMGLFMLGFLEETEEQFFETIKFGKALKCDWTLYSCVTPFPGSELYYEAKTKEMLPENIEDDFEQLDFKSYVLNPRHLSKEFVLRERYFANLDQNFFENPNLSNGRTEIALSDFKNVIKLSPTHASAYYCIGKIYKKKGERTLAKQYYRLAKENLSGLHKEYFKKLGLEIP